MLSLVGSTLPEWTAAARSEKLLYHFLLNVRRLCHHIVVNSPGYTQVQLIGSLNVGSLLEQAHQLGQVKELRKARSGPVAGAFGRKLDGSLRFTESRCPTVKVRQPLVPNQVMLKVSHHGIKLGHAVGYGRSGGEHYAFAVRDLIDVPALEQHIRGFLRVRGGQPGHIAHLGIKEQVFEAVRFIHKQPIHAQLLEGDHVIFAHRILKLFQPRRQSLSGLFHLLDGESLSTAFFQFRNALLDLVDLFFEQPFLPFQRYRNPLELAVSDNDGIIIARRNARAELFAVARFKVLSRSEQDIGRRIQTQKLRRPLFGQMIGYSKERLMT